MKNFSYFSEKFVVGRMPYYTMAIQAGSNFYDYVIIDTTGNEYVALKSVSFQEQESRMPFYSKMKNVVDKDAFLSKKLKMIKMAYTSTKNILVPSPLFNSKTLRKMFEINHVLEDEDGLYFNYLPCIDAYNIFSMPSNVTTFMINKFDDVKFYHHSTPFILSAFEYKAKNKANLPVIHINVNDTFFDILVIVENKLQLYNTFPFKENTDIMYYTANVLKQLELKPQKVSLYISGKLINKQSNLTAYMKTLFPLSETVKHKTEMLYEYPEVPEHLIYNTLNLYKCE